MDYVNFYNKLSQFFSTVSWAEIETYYVDYVVLHYKMQVSNILNETGKAFIIYTLAGHMWHQYQERILIAHIGLFHVV